MAQQASPLLGLGEGGGVDTSLEVCCWCWARAVLALGLRMNWGGWISLKKNLIEKNIHSYLACVTAT